MRKTLLEAVHELDLAFNRKDLDATLGFYSVAVNSSGVLPKMYAPGAVDN